MALQVDVPHGHPTRAPLGLPYDDLVPSIHREQQAPVTLYDLEKPFIGMGACRKSWSFAMELRKLPEETRGQVPAQSSAANGAGAASPGGPRSA